MSDLLDPEKADYSSFDSHVTIEIEAVMKHPLRYPPIEEQEKTEYGETDRYFETDGSLVIDKRLGNSIINIDSYFDPDYTYDIPDTIEYDGVEVQRLHSVEYKFDLYRDELLVAARQRAAEDSQTPMRVLAGWLHRALGSENVSHTDAGIFLSTLKMASQHFDDDDWIVGYDGDPNHRHADEHRLPETVEEAEMYYRYEGDLEIFQAEMENDQ